MTIQDEKKLLAGAIQALKNAAEIRRQKPKKNMTDYRNQLIGDYTAQAIKNLNTLMEWYNND